MDCEGLTTWEYVIPSFKRRNIVNFLLKENQLRNIDVVNFWLNKEPASKEQEENHYSSTETIASPKETLSFLTAENLLSFIREKRYDQLLGGLRDSNNSSNRIFSEIYKCFFHTYYKQFQRRIMAYARKKSFSEILDNFEECTFEGFQEGYMAFYFALIRPKEFDFTPGKILFKDYFLLFCHNQCLKLAGDRYRSKQKNGSLIKEVGHLTGGIEEEREDVLLYEILYSQQEKLLLEAVALLDEKTKKLVDLRYLKGLKRQHIADITGESPENISRILNRGLNNLRVLMERLKKGKR